MPSFELRPCQQCGTDWYQDNYGRMVNDCTCPNEHLFMEGIFSHEEIARIVEGQRAKFIEDMSKFGHFSTYGGMNDEEATPPTE